MNKVIESLMICNSNMFVPTVLTEVLGHPENTYLIISDTKSITQFFNFLSLANVKYIDYGYYKNRIDIFLRRRRLLKQVMSYDVKKLVFFHAEHGAMANWLIKKLANKLPIKYCKIYDTIPAPYCKNIVSVVRIKLSQLVYWGTNVDVLFHVRPFPSLPKSFFSDISAETISMPIDNKLISRMMDDCLKKIKISGNYVLLTGTVVKEGYYSEDVYTEFINKLISEIGIENLISKCHPRFNSLYGLERELPQIPSFIPGNVLLDNYNYYIGFESTLLVEAAVAGKTAISLVDWLCPSEIIKNGTHDFFDSRLQGRGIIYYPKSMEEFLSNLGI